MLARRIAATHKLTKPRLLEACRACGVQGNANTPKAQLAASLVAFYRAQAGGMAAAFAARRSDGARGSGPSSPREVAEILPACLLPHSASDAAAHGTADGAGSSRHAPPSSALVERMEPMAPATAPRSPSTSPSPPPPPGKRPRVEAPPFRPAILAGDGAAPPRPCAKPPRPRLEPPPANALPADLDARRRSHAAASVRPARLDELLELQSELRRRQLCVRGLADSEGESAEELGRKLGEALGAIVGRPTAMTDAYRVGRFHRDRPRPIIVRFANLETKLQVL